MKTLAVALLLCCSCVDSLAQGVVQFRNYRTNTIPPIDAPVYLDGVTRLDASNPLWRAALIGGPTTATPASLSSAGTLQMMFGTGANSTISWVNFRSGTTPPIAAGYVNCGSAFGRAVPGVDWGGTALVQMVAWQGAYTSWAEAYSAWRSGMPGVRIGFSNPLTLQLPSSYTDLNVTYLWGLQSFSFLQCLDCYYFGGSTGPYDVTANVGDAVTLSVSVNAWPQPWYDWYFNGKNIPSGNRSWGVYEIPSVLPADAGQYYVVMSHILGTFTSQTATLTVRVAKPLILAQPQSQTAAAGASAVLRVEAIGEAPMTYQWLSNGTGLLAPGPLLELTNLQPENSGIYTVIISNHWGSVTSAPAMLNVIPPAPIASAPTLVASTSSGTVVNLEYAGQMDSVMNWQPLAELVPSTNFGPVYIDWPPVSSNRFFRAWQTNGAIQPPLLSMRLVPAITLTGTIGNSIRIDSINQIGPTDAWVTLATVTLTNTSQEYFDTSAIGQPPRLYRLSPGP